MRKISLVTLFCLTLLVVLTMLPAGAHETGLDAHHGEVGARILWTRIAMRWLHILSAVVLVGGAVFTRFALLPAASAVLDDATRQTLRAAVLGRWKGIVHTGIFFFLVSGFYNYLTFTRHLHDGQALYHALFGVKFLLALVVFALAILLTSNKAYAARIQANHGKWTGVLVALAVVVVLISGYMRFIPVVD
jgi:uncharacterized membrane protein